MIDSPDKNCYTLPDGSCVGTNCMHDVRDELDCEHGEYFVFCEECSPE